MGSLNKVLLIGNLGKDPELRYTPDGLAILGFPMATTEFFNDKSGTRNERTTWHNITVFGKMGQNIANYLSKGKQVFVEGRIRTSSYDDKDGVKRYRTDIVATNIVLLGGKGNANAPEGIDADAKFDGGMEAGYSSGGGAHEDDDIPF